MSNIKSRISLNGITLAKVPDQYNFHSFVGMDGYSVFSASEIINSIKNAASELKIDLSLYRHNDLPKILTACLTSDDVQIKQVSENIVADFGKRLGLILYTLKTADEINQKANGEYESFDW